MGSLFQDMLDGYTKAVSTANDYLSAPLKPVQAAANNVNAGILSAIPSTPAVIDMARIAGSSAINAFDRPDEQSYKDAFLDNMSNGILPPEGQQQLQDLLAQKTEEFVKQNPTATPSEQQQFIKDYSKTDEFMKATYDNMSWGVGFGQKAAWAANEVAGVNKRPDELTPGEQGLQILGQSAIGLTEGVINDVVKGVTRVTGEKVANSLVTKIGAKVIEAATPLTLPLNPTNVAINTGVGLGVDNAIRYAQGEDTLFSSMAKADTAQKVTQVAENAKPYDPNEAAPSPTQTTDASFGILGAASLLFGGRPARIIGQQIATHADDAFIDTIRTATKDAATLAQQSDRLQPTINNTTSDLFDSVQPVTDVMKKLGASGDDLADIDAIASAGTTNNRGVQLSNAFNMGKLENVDDTIPLKQFTDTITSMPENDRALLNDYVYARMRKQDTSIQSKGLETDVIAAQDRYTQAVATGNRRTIRAAEKDLTEAMQSRSAAMGDDPTMRPNMDQWSNADVDNIIRIGNNNPAVKKIADAMQKTSNDIANYLHKNGVIDDAAKAKWLRDRPLYIPLAEAEHAGLSSFDAGKKMLTNSFNDFMNGVRGNAPKGVPSFSKRDISGAGAKVNQPRDILDGLQEMYYSAVHEVTTNNARRDVVDRMLALGNDKAIRKVGYGVDIGNRPHVQILRNGKKEVYELADEAVARALDFAPQSAIAILNGSRKFAQSLTTGVYAPWFAPKAFIWDNVMAPVLAPKGRSMGLLDTFARRIAQGTAVEGAVNKLADTIPDPSSWLTSLAAIPYQQGMKAAHAVGQMVARDLVGNNAFLDAIAKQSPQGAKLIEAVGDQMAMAFDRSVYNIYHQNINGHTYGNEAISNNLLKINNRIGKIGKVGGTLLRPYKAIMESVHDATRMSFFVQNYGTLALKYGDNIPADEMRRLVRDTKALTSDLSRTSGRMRVQQAASAVPYSNATIQGTRYVLKSMYGPNASKFWSRSVATLLPVIGAYAFLDKWRGASEHWNERTPAYQRVTNIPMPKLSVLAEAQRTGKMPDFTPDKLDMIPLPPEMSMLFEPVLTGLRTMGLLGGQGGAGLGGPLDQLKQSFSQVTTFMTPPAAEALLAYSGYTTRFGGIQPVNDKTGGQGAGQNMMTPDSEIPNTLYNVISAFFGSAANIATQTFNAYDIASDKEASFSKAFSDALDVGATEIKTKLPQISVPTIWDGERRMSAGTPEAEYTYKTLNTLDPIIGTSRQISVERDANGDLQQLADEGYATPAKIKDPLLKNVSEALYTQIKQKGTFKGLSDAYTDTRKRVEALDRMRVGANQRRYLQMRNTLIQQQQSIRSSQAKLLQKMENTLSAQVGPAFEERYGVPFSFDNLTKLVVKDVQSQR